MARDNRTAERIAQGARLREARKRLYPKSAAPVYTALGIPKPTYDQYESGRLGLSQSGERLARFFRVNLEWLLTGKGEPYSKKKSIDIEIHGVVGAGAQVLPIEDDLEAIDLGAITIQDPDAMGALIVKGDSGYPRFRNGEAIIFYNKQLLPHEVADQEAIVQTLDGRKLIKTARPEPSSPGRFTLESFNAPPERNIELLCGWRIHSIVVR